LTSCMTAPHTQQAGPSAGGVEAGNSRLVPATGPTPVI
jgi:hypothetical protein